MGVPSIDVYIIHEILGFRFDVFNWYCAISVATEEGRSTLSCTHQLVHIKIKKNKTNNY